MPLVKNTLASALRKFMDEEYSSFDKFPDSGPIAESKLADAVDQYASVVIPASTTASQAKAAMLVALQGMGEQEQAITKIKAGFTQYATMLATGMAPAFTAVPPSGQIPIEPVENIGLNGGTAEDVASKIADIADAWFKTGTATPSSGGSPVAWS